MTEALAQTVLQMGMTNYQPLPVTHFSVMHFMHFIPSLRTSVTQILSRVLYVGSICTMWRRFRPMWSNVVISCTVFRHNAFSTEITEKNFNIVHINKYVTCLRSIDKK